MIETGSEKRARPVKRGDWRNRTSRLLVVPGGGEYRRYHGELQKVQESTIQYCYRNIRRAVHGPYPPAVRQFSSGQGKEWRVPTAQRSTYSTTPVLCLALASPLGKRPECPVPGSWNGMSTVSGGRW